MRVSDIISFLKEYIILAIVALIFAGVIFLVGYKIIYKKVMKGTKTIKKGRMILYAITLCYAVIVLGAVFLNRGGVYGVLNLHLFSSYKEAYHKMEMSLFRNIILNILLFAPLGFLLPIYSDKLKKIYKAVPIGFLVAIIIETLQYITKLGIFEIDDIFNNTLGTLIGYCIFMTYNCLRKKENRKNIIGYMLPIIAIISTFAIIYIKYENQELGNLAFEYNYKINMKNVEIKNEATLSKNESDENIYYKDILTEEETQEIAKNIFEKLGTSINENETDIYENTAIYYSNKRQHSMWIRYKGGTYSFTDYTQFSHDNQEKSGKNNNASREEVEKALQQLSIEIPENAKFNIDKNGDYLFSVDMQLEQNNLINGTLRCSYYEDGTIKNVQNNLVKYEKVMNKKIISQEDAYNQILAGKFNCYINDDIKTITVKEAKLSYFLDSKGYYVPVYNFHCKINDRDMIINIKAVKS